MITRRSLLSLFTALCASWSVTAIPQPRAASESSIKAGYLLLFTRYVEWPEAVFARASDPIVICVAGPDPLGSVLDETIRGLRSQDRELAVRRVRNLDEAGACHLAYVSGADSAARRGWLAAFASRPVLTITEDPATLEDGAVLCFVRETVRDQSRIRFEISLRAAERAGLKVSAGMLMAARKVHRDADA